MKPRTVTIILVAVITVLSIHVLHRVLEGARVDVTSQSIYSLSEGTRQILDRMNEEGPAGRVDALLLRHDGEDAASLHQGFRYLRALPPASPPLVRTCGPRARSRSALSIR